MPSHRNAISTRTICPHVSRTEFSSFVRQRPPGIELAGRSCRGESLASKAHRGVVQWQWQVLRLCVGSAGRMGPTFESREFVPLSSNGHFLGQPHPQRQPGPSPRPCRHHPQRVPMPPMPTRPLTRTCCAVLHHLRLSQRLKEISKKSACQFGTSPSRRNLPAPPMVPALRCTQARGEPSSHLPRPPRPRADTFSFVQAHCVIHKTRGVAIAGGIRRAAVARRPRVARLRQFISRARLSAHGHYAVPVTGHTALPWADGTRSSRG